MALRYWVGGDGSWHDTSHWSTSSGGGGGASIPNSTDDVFIDTNSYGAGTSANITFNSDANFSTLNCEHATQNSDILIFTLNCDEINFHGSGISTPSSNFFITNNTNAYLVKKGGYGVYQPAGNTIFTYLKVYPGSTLVISDFLGGSFSQGNIKNVICGDSSDSNASELRLSTTLDTETLTVYNGGIVRCVSPLYVTGSGTILDVKSGGSIIEGSNYIEPASTNVTINNSGTISSYFYIDPPSGNYTFTFNGNGSFSSVRRSSTVNPMKLRFSTTSDLKFSSWNIEGQSGALVTISSNFSGIRASITKTGGGVVSTEYVSVSDMQPYPDDTWISYNSIDNGNNYQWYFDDFTKPTSTLFFGSHV